MRKPHVAGVSLLLLAVTVILSGCDSSSSSAPADTSSPTQAATEVSSATASGGSGAYPTPQEETFLGCPPQGDGGDSQLNLRKNRIDSASWQSTSLGELLSLSWPSSVQKTARSSWSANDAASVAQNEGRPVVVEGYILKIRHEGPESPNCHVQTERDYHVWLASSPSESRANAMVVEFTPRVVALNPGWGSETSLLHLAGRHVRIAGWLLLDQEHPEQLHQTRGTLWEIHPIMHVDVEKSGNWIDLAGGNTLAPSSQNTSLGSTTSRSRTITHHTRRHSSHKSS